MFQYRLPSKHSMKISGCGHNKDRRRMQIVQQSQEYFLLISNNQMSKVNSIIGWMATFEFVNFKVNLVVVKRRRNMLVFRLNIF